MTDDANRLDVLSAVDDLRTGLTRPMAQQIHDWVAGKLALRGEHSPFGGPPPWHGLRDVLADLEAAGLVELGPGGSPSTTADDASVAPDGLRVAITEQGLKALGR